MTNKERNTLMVIVLMIIINIVTITLTNFIYNSDTKEISAMIFNSALFTLIFAGLIHRYQQ